MNKFNYGLCVLIGLLLLLFLSQVSSLIATDDIDGLMLVGAFSALLIWGMIKSFK